jgi:hypothetical protein
MDIAYMIIIINSVTMYHVRDIIGKINYDTITDLLPTSKFVVFDNTKVSKYPPLVAGPPKLKIPNRHKYSLFGLFVDYLVRKMIQSHSTSTENTNGMYFLHHNDGGEDSIFNEQKTWEQVLTSIYSHIYHTSYSDGDKTIESFTGWFKKLYSNIYDPVGGLGNYIMVQSNAEINYGEVITSHPDLICDNCVIDIKISANFEKMKKQSILQILSYYCILRENGYQTTEVGIYLPLQKRLLTCDVSGWNYKPFLNHLVKVVDDDKKTSAEASQIDINQYAQYVGNHTSKKNSIYESILAFYENGNYLRPCQMFLRGNQGAGRCKTTNEDILNTKQYITLWGIIYIIIHMHHIPSIYVILLMPQARKIRKLNHGVWNY